MVEPVSDQRTIRAAGAVLWRHGEAGGLEIAVVHRPRYDDWSLPKGKVDPGETTAAAASREVVEETGFLHVLGRFLSTIAYTVPARGGAGSIPKTVDYFSARAESGAFDPNSEVDALRWVSPEKARGMLTYSMDVAVLDEFIALGANLTTVLLVRHAKAGKREGWTGDDDLRPLSDAGLRQAEALRALLPLFRPDRIVSAPRLRCVQTVSPLAEDLGVGVEHESTLSEEVYWQDPALGIARMLSVVSHGGTPVICSQGGVIPDLVGALATRAGLSVGRIVSKKGSIWQLSFESDPDDTRPLLRAAHYLPSPLPTPLPTV